MTVQANAVLIEGVEWYQPIEFTDISSRDLMEIFDSSGNIIDHKNTQISSYDFEGMVWASVSEVYEMLEFYYGDSVPIYSSINEEDSSWAS